MHWAEVNFTFYFLSGADLSALVRESAMIALSKYLKSSLPPEKAEISMEHVLEALNKIKPSVSKEQAAVYKKLFLMGGHA
jgi:SpoVK/Ycf46/Vps4 family AAA+-type ATPase